MCECEQDGTDCTGNYCVMCTDVHPWDDEVEDAEPEPHPFLAEVRDAELWGSAFGPAE